MERSKFLGAPKHYQSAICCLGFRSFFLSFSIINPCNKGRLLSRCHAMPCQDDRAKNKTREQRSQKQLLYPAALLHENEILSFFLKLLKSPRADWSLVTRCHSRLALRELDLWRGNLEAKNQALCKGALTKIFALMTDPGAKIGAPYPSRIKFTTTKKTKNTKTKH